MLIRANNEVKLDGVKAKLFSFYQTMFAKLPTDSFALMFWVHDIPCVCDMRSQPRLIWFYSVHSKDFSFFTLVNIYMHVRSKPDLL